LSDKATTFFRNHRRCPHNQTPVYLACGAVADRRGRRLSRDRQPDRRCSRAARRGPGATSPEPLIARDSISRSGKSFTRRAFRQSRGASTPGSNETLGKVRLLCGPPAGRRRPEAHLAGDSIDHAQINAHIGMIGDPMTALVMRLHAGDDASKFPTPTAPRANRGPPGVPRP